MHKLNLLVVLCLVAAGPAFGGQEKNLVLKRPYTYFPEPMYNNCKDDGDITQLTDGASHYGANMWMNRSCVGWARGIDVPVVMHFDLGGEATLRELRFNTCGGGGAGVVEVGLRIFVSLDDKGYVPAAEHKAPAPPPANQHTRTGVQVKVSLDGVRARYVAVVGMAPAPYYFVFVDEIEIIGKLPADPKSNMPVQGAIFASGARGLQELLAGGKRAANLMEDLTAPIERHVKCWPDTQAKAQRQDVAAARRRAVRESDKYDEIRTAITTGHRERARQVYGADTLVWETLPDEAFTMLSLPTVLSPACPATIHTVINGLEATALGAANLSTKRASLKVEVSAGGKGAPAITPRVGHFFETTNARYVPDALLATDCPQVLPPGESKLVWLLAESTGAAAGTYQYQVTVTIGDDTHAIPLTVRVHNVTLSADTPISTGNWSDLNTGEGPLFAEVRDSMLSHRMTMGAASAQGFPKKGVDGKVIRPIEIDFTDMDKFLTFHKDFAQVSWFFPFDPHGPRPHYDWFGPADWMSDEFKDVFREWLVKMVEHVKSKGRGYGEFYFHLFDETLSAKVAQLCELVHSADPKVRVKCTIPQASQGATSHFVSAGMNIFNYHATQLEFDNAPDGFPTLRSGGRELWIYGAADAAFGGGKERDPLGFFRYMHWTAFHHGATGVHFWNMFHNNGRSPTWAAETVEQNYWPMVYPIGPGYQKPPADVTTAEKIVPSRRWEYVRMGIEDYMLLAMAKARIDALGARGATHRKRLDAIIKTVVTNRSADRRLFREKRGELVKLVEQLPGE